MDKRISSIIGDRLIYSVFFCVLSIICLSSIGYDGYSFSIISSTPPLSIVIIGSAFFGSILHLYFTDSRLPVIAILLSNIYILFLPLIKGYVFFGRGDGLTHIGILRDVILTGQISGNSYYPALSIHSSSITLLTDLEVYTVGLLYPALLSVIYLVFSRYTHRYFGDQGTGLWALTAMPIFSFSHYYFGPHFIAFYIFLVFVPLTLRAINGNNRDIIMYSILAISLTFWHPLQTLYIIIFSGIIGIIYSSRSDQVLRLSLLSSIPVLTLIYPKIHNKNILDILSITFSNLLLSSGSAQYTRYTSSLSIFPLSEFEIVVLLFTRRGIATIAFLTGIIITVIIAYRANNITQLLREYSFLAIFWISGGTSLLILISGFPIGWDRVLYFTILGAFLPLARLLPKIKRSNIIIVIIALLITGVVLLSLFPGPISRDTNPQVTHTQLDGAEWIFEYDLVESGEIYGPSLQRYYLAKYGRNGDYTKFSDRNTLPSHLPVTGLDSYPSYYVTSDRIRGYYPNLHPKYEKYWKYNNSDFERISNSKKVAKIYSNADIEVYRITK